ncbi:MAG: hypothetical protein Q4C47_06145 [Planctomycetia bacterium]|nr:hypothetical protein [Planctomycetia bacterium]
MATESVLEDVFCGPNGLVNLLSDMLGGSIRLTYVLRQGWDETRNRDVSDETYQVLPFVPGDTVSSNGSEEETILATRMCTGSVPSACLIREPVADRDRFEFRGILYRITRVEPVSVGNRIAAYTLTGVRI